MWTLLCGNSVRASENRAFRSGLAAINAVARCRGLLQWNAPHRGARLFLDFRFAVSATAPGCQREARFDRPLQVVVSLRLMRIRFAEGQRFVEHRLLDFDQQLLDRLRNVGKRRADSALAPGSIPARQHGRLLGDILWAEFDADGHTTHLPVVELPAGAVPFALVEDHPNVCFCELALQITSRL